MTASVPLDTLAGEIIACYNKGNDMLISAGQRMLAAKERLDAGELGPDWPWLRWRAAYLEPHLSKRWINQQLRIAASPDPEKAAQEHRAKAAAAVRKHREQSSGNYVIPTAESHPAEHSSDLRAEQTAVEAVETGPADDEQTGAVGIAETEDRAAPAQELEQPAPVSAVDVYGIIKGMPFNSAYATFMF